MAASLPNDVLVAGACLKITDDSLVSCAFQPSDCANNGQQRFMTPWWLQVHHPTIAATCATQSSMRNQIHGLGRCQDDANDQFLCTTHASACIRSLNFAASSSDCTLSYDWSPETAFDRPFFGRCGFLGNPDKDFCAWQSSECENDNPSLGTYVWSKAHPDLLHTTAVNCDCHQVHVGACTATQTDQDATSETIAVSFCAVTAEVCDQQEGFSYVSALDYRTRFKRSCRLCDSSDVEVPLATHPASQPVSVPVVPAPVASPTLAPISEAVTSPRTPAAPVTISQPWPATSSSTTNNSSSRRSPQGVMVGTVVGVSMVVLAGIVVIMHVVGWRRRQHATARGQQLDKNGHPLQLDEETESPVPVEDAISA